MKFEDFGKCAKKFTFSEIKIFQTLLNPNLGEFSMDNLFSEVLEVVEGCFWNVNTIFRKVLQFIILWLLLFGDVISKSLMIELVLCWDSRAFERFVDFYLFLFLLFLSVQLQWHRTIWVGLCTFELVLFSLSVKIIWDLVSVSEEHRLSGCWIFFYRKLLLAAPP